MAYDRQAAVTYASRWWNRYNPQFRSFPSDDCTNYISQCLWAGGLPMEDTGRRETGWWYRGPDDAWSFSWTVANALRWYLSGSKRAVGRPTAKGLDLGDIITYDWNGDDIWTHSTIVVGSDATGEPLVAGHTVPSFRRPWSYSDSRSFTEETKYLFWHITG
jgi:hypothetical protein